MIPLSKIFRGTEVPTKTLGRSEESGSKLQIFNYKSLITDILNFVLSVSFSRFFQILQLKTWTERLLIFLFLYNFLFLDIFEIHIKQNPKSFRLKPLKKGLPTKIRYLEPWKYLPYKSKTVNLSICASLVKLFYDVINLIKLVLYSGIP